MPRLELGADGMVRFDGRIIAEIAYQTCEFEEIIEAANDAFKNIKVYCEYTIPTAYTSPYLSEFRASLEKSGWWKS